VVALRVGPPAVEGRARLRRHVPFDVDGEPVLAHQPRVRGEGLHAGIAVYAAQEGEWFAQASDLGEIELPAQDDVAQRDPASGAQHARTLGDECVAAAHQMRRLEHPHAVE
jgi:hypothetical protein